MAALDAGFRAYCDSRGEQFGHVLAQWRARQPFFGDHVIALASVSINWSKAPSAATPWGVTAGVNIQLVVAST